MGKPGPETKLIRKMRETAKAKYGEHIVIVKYHGSAMGEAGVSDLLICLDGNFIAVEVKAPDNYGNSVDRAVRQGPTVKQIAFLERIGEAGGQPMVCASVDGFMSMLHDVAGW